MKLSITINKYWRERGITSAFPFRVNQEKWIDRNSRDMCFETFFYYQSYDRPLDLQDWQRTPLSDSSFPRKSLPGWMTRHRSTSWWYKPRPWDYYYQKDLVLVEGIPDALTWWEVGVPAIGARTAWIVQREDAQAELDEFIHLVQPRRIFVVPDPDFPNFYSPNQDISRFWFKAFQRLSPLYLDWRHRSSVLWSDLVSEFKREFPIRPPLDQYRCWNQSHLSDWDLPDSNRLWTSLGCHAPAFLEDVRSFFVKKPCMPNYWPQGPSTPVSQKSVLKQGERFVTAEDFISHYGLRMCTIPVNRWYRGLCPVKAHKREGQPRRRDMGAFGLFVGDRRLVLRCHAGCTEEMILAALGASEDHLYLRRL